MHVSLKRSPDGDFPGPRGPHGDTLPPESPAFSLRPSERRRHVRRDVVNQQLIPIQLGANNGGLIVDLSAGGAAVVAVAPMEQSSVSPFTLQLDDGRSEIEGTGEFVWVDSTGLNGGLRFDHLSKKAKQSLDQWLNRDPSAETDLPDPEPDSELQTETLASASIPAEAQSPEFMEQLQRLVERAQIVAGANGACIALRGAEGLRCEAAIGTAPDVGLPVSQERGLAAECIAGKHLVVCNEASRDPRVSAEARRQLSFESAIFLPLCHDAELIGILGVFSEHSDAFGEQAIERMQGVARVVEARIIHPLRSEAARPSRRAGDVVELTAQPADTSVARADRIGFANLRNLVVAVSFLTAAVVGSILYLHRAPSPAPSSKSQPAPAAVLNKAESPATPVTTQPLPVSSPTADRTASATPSPRQSQTAKPAVTERTQPVVVERPKSAETPHTPTNAPAAAEALTPPVLPQTQAAQKPPVISPPEPVVAIPPAPAQKQNAALTQVASASVPVAAAPPVATPEPAPRVEVITEVLPDKPGATAPPAAQVISKTDIHYPTDAVAAHRQGSVILKVTLDRTGAVKDVQVLDGDQALAAEAVRAVRQWRYRPYESGRRNQAVELLLTVNFVLGR